MLSRRDFVIRLGLASLPFALRPSTGHPSALSRDDAFQPPLSGDELRTLDAVAEGILPATDTPGARGAGVPDFIALLFSDWMSASDQQVFRQGLSDLDLAARNRTGHSFADSSEASQLGLLKEWDTQAAQVPPGGPPTFFRRLKSLVVIGYYTSEVGQTDELKIQFGGGQSEPGGPVMVAPPFRVT